ncbi:MAG: alpha-L-fucosidase [Promethearchaeota archaeon]
MKYEPSVESLNQHQVSDWYHDAKLGIFIHWGLFSVPAFADTGIDLVESSKRGSEVHFRNNPYAEWYLNSLRVPDSSTQKYHVKTYGDEFSYDDFGPIFNEHIKNWNPKEWTSLFRKIGAKYVVFTTKHCDGFLMWPSKYPNPNKENYIASRDIVGELTKAVEEEGMNMGFYYSSAWDWSFNLFPIKDGPSFIKHYISTPEYARWVTNHWYELIDKYKPTILWSDMGYPADKNPLEIVAYFYNKLPDGVVNDRWNQYLSDEKKFKPIKHNDFTTPEYKVLKRISNKKWEVCRGIGNSFGYNKFESEEDYLKVKDLIFLLVDIVSKNGNLLLNVGPTVDGLIPEIQKERLLGLGKWLDVNGDAIFGTRPWKYAEGITTDGIPIRFTHKGNDLYVILIGKPESSEVIVENLNSENISKVKLLGIEEDLPWRLENGNLIIELLKKIEDSPAISFKLELNSNN